MAAGQSGSLINENPQHIIFKQEELRAVLDSFSESDKILSHIKTLISQSDKIYSTWFIHNSKFKSIFLNRSSYENGVFEVHKLNYDLHYVLSGFDSYYFLDDEKERGPYFEKEDYQIVKGQGKAPIKLKTGEGILIPPGLVHSSKISGKGLKIVTKINKILWRK